MTLHFLELALLMNKGSRKKRTMFSEWIDLNPGLFIKGLQRVISIILKLSWHQTMHASCIVKEKLWRIYVDVAGCQM